MISKRLLAAGLAAALVAAPLALPVTPASAQNGGNNAGNTGQEFAPDAPRSFFLPKSQWDLPSWWTREGPGLYREKYEAGAGREDNLLRIVGRAVMNGVPGTLVYRPEVAVFVPDAGTGSEWVGLYWRGEWQEKWRRIEQVQGP